MGEDEEQPDGFAYVGGVLESIQQQNDEIIKSLHNIERLLQSSLDTKAAAPPAAPAPAPQAPAEPPKKGATLSEMARRLKEQEGHMQS